MPQTGASNAWAHEFETQQSPADAWAEQFREQNFEDVWQEQNVRHLSQKTDRMRALIFDASHLASMQIEAAARLRLTWSSLRIFVLEVCSVTANWVSLLPRVNSA